MKKLNTTLLQRTTRVSSKLSLIQFNAKLNANRVRIPLCQICNKSAAAFSLCESDGQPLPRKFGGFCRACVPLQIPGDELDTLVPNLNDEVDFDEVLKQENICQPNFGVASRSQLWRLQVERTSLRITKAELNGMLYNLRWRSAVIDIFEEYSRVERRLAAVNEMLIFEPDFNFDTQPWDEEDADLSDELDGSFANPDYLEES